MTLSGATERENRILRIALCAFSETVGTFTLQGVRKVVTEPELRKQNQLHLTDELQHSRAAWAHLFTLNDDARAVVRRALPRLFDILSVAYRGSSERSDELLVPYGYFTPEVLRRAHEEALREVILPGLSHLGITEAA
jgi:hypothetical protein